MSRYVRSPGRLGLTVIDDLPEPISLDEIDFGDYKIKDGKLHVSNKPGFGMKLLI